jgi:butyrate kinase
MKNILVINPGSTSTKIAMYDEKRQLWQQNIEHDAANIKAFETIYAQLDFRLNTVLDAVAAHGNKPDELACVMSRGGLLPPLGSGAYEVNKAMLDVLEHRPMNHHASNLGAAIAYRIAKPLSIKAYIYDPVTVDEMLDLVRITGLKEIRRHGQGHSLNMRAAALKYCENIGLNYKEQSLIVAHLGGGITLSLHHKGRIIDMVSDDEGAFSSERAGLIPAYKLAKFAYTDGMNYSSLMKKLQRGGGLISLIGEPDTRKVEARIAENDAEAKLAYEAMALSVARSIAMLAVVINGKTDQIILTGGVAYSIMFTGMVEERVRFISPVTVIPGENEMQALADGARRVLSGKEQAHVYVEQNDRPF